MTTNTEILMPTDVITDCECRVCRRKTRHEVLAQVMVRGVSSNDYEEIQWARTHQIVRCRGCENLGFRRAVGTDQDYIQTGPNEWEYEESIDLYPSPHEGRQPLSDVSLLPDKIQRIYEETLASLNGRHQVLTGIGLRVLIEAVCTDKASPGKDLFHKINGLVTQGVLTKDGAEILHKLRTLGNNAAHEVKPHSQEELGLALDVVEHLLSGVYILPLHAKMMFQ